jgi:hypothetical protein
MNMPEMPAPMMIASYSPTGPWAVRSAATSVSGMVSFPRFKTVRDWLLASLVV